MKEIRYFTNLEMMEYACGIDEIEETISKEEFRKKTSGFHKNPLTNLSDNVDYFSEAYLKLMRMCGLANVKHEVDRLIAGNAVARGRAKVDFKKYYPRRNTMLIGGRGSGKTTIARLLAKIFPDYGLSKAVFMVEADRKTLIGSDIRETEEKIEQLAAKASRGTIIIDDIHWLAAGMEEPAVRHAASLLTGLIAEPGRDITFIATGSEEDFHRLWLWFPGLVSSLSVKIHIDEYSDEELLEIAMAHLYEQGFVLTADGRMTFSTLIEMVKERKRFANVRTIRDAIDSYIIPEACVRLQLEEADLSHYLNIDMVDFPDLTELARALCGE